MSILEPCRYCGGTDIVIDRLGPVCRRCTGTGSVYWPTPPKDTRPAPDWQDISTAPRDGTIVLLREEYRLMSGFLKFSGQHYKWYWQVISRPSGNYSSAVRMSFHPTHWMPIPAPPKEGDQ